jgi:hypothetical protein
VVVVEVEVEPADVEENTGVPVLHVMPEDPPQRSPGSGVPSQVQADCEWVLVSKIK